MNDATTIEPIDRTEMAGLARNEYQRLFDVIGELTPEEWATPTVCDDWNVHLMVAHLLGAAEANASVAESVRQLVKGKKIARREGVEEIDGINAVQVDARGHLSPSELVVQLREVAPAAIKGRQRIPALARRMRIETGVGYRMTMGHLVDRVYTRDQWMHRIDITAATNRELVLTPEHDGRIVEDVVVEWAERHGEPFQLMLDGPAGGGYRVGDGGVRIEMDAIEFCLVLAGRLDKPMPLSVPVVF